ncbi:MAG: LysR family transcriptional regulator [Bacteroidales bacterium]|nr:LysR family transcriptional regulator [Candidatus Liminaster caballi]
MELRQLKYFVGVADTCSFSEASRKLYVSQSAISQQIKMLEDELNAQLFIRQHNNVALTENGATLYPLAKQILANMEECHTRMKELKDLLCGELSIGLTYSLESYMRGSMLEFLRRYPKVRVNAHYKNLPELLRMLRNEEIDMMLSMMPTSPHEFIDSIPLTEYHLAAVMNRQHTLARKSSITFHDLLPHKLILPEKGLRDRNAIESFVHKETGNLNVQAIVNDVNALLNIIQDSNYVTILTEASIANRTQLCFVPIEELKDPITIYAHFNNQVAKKNSAMKLFEILQQSAHLRQISF